MELIYRVALLIKNIVFNIFTIIANIFIKRDNKIILFGGRAGMSFAGNCRFLFQYCVSEISSLDIKKVVWVTRNKKVYAEMKAMGYECYMIHSFKSIYFHLKAGYHIINGSYISWLYSDGIRRADILTSLSYGAKCYHLSHAAKAPKGMESKSSSVYRHLIRFYKLICSNDFLNKFVLTPGGWGNHVYLGSNDFADNYSDRVVQCGLPELCPCIKYKPSELSFFSSLPSNHKYILYVPTVHMNKAKEYKHPLNNKEFIEYLRQNNYFWIEKLHPTASDDMKANYYDSDCSVLLDKSFDINVLIPMVDILVTDYSSIYQKAIWFDKPYSFYTSDLIYYTNKDSGLMNWFIDFASNQFCCDVESLKKDINIKLTSEYLINHQNDYLRLKKEYFNVEVTNYNSIYKMLFL